MTAAGKISRIRAAALLLLAALLLSVAIPMETFAESGDKEAVKVGFFAMDGYHNEDETGARSGYGYEFLQLVARYSDLKFEYVGYDKSWEEMQQMLLSGEIDLLTSAQKTPERETLYGFSSTLIGTSAAILTVKAGDERYEDGNYDGMRVGLVHGNSRNERLKQFMDERGFSYTPVYYHGMNELTEALQKGTEIDAAMTSNLRWTENEWTLETLDSAPYYAIVRKDDTELLAQVNDAIKRMDVDSAGWRTRLLNKYYSMNNGEVVAFTAEEREYMDGLNASGRILRVTMNPDCAPYSYFENGEARGILADIFKEVAARMGLAYEMIEPADREDYQRLTMDGDVDVILDGMDDYYTVETNGLEISDAYYTTPLAVLTTKTSLSEIQSLAQPQVSVLNERCFAYVYDGKNVDQTGIDTYDDAAAAVKGGKADGAYMPYYCAQWQSNGDVTGRLNCLMLPQYERAYVYAVGAGEDYPLLSSLNKAVLSLSEDYIAAIVARNTDYPDSGTSLLGFVYQNLLLVAVLLLAFIAVIVAALFFADKNRRAQTELRRSRRLERYIGYLCDVHYKVLEVDLELRTRRQYMKRDGVVEIEERDDFSGFDIDSIYPDDVESCLAIFDPRAVRQLAASDQKERYVECRMRSEDGTYRWYSFLLKTIPRDDEHPCSAMLLIKDIDDMRRERERSHEALVNALDAANIASRSKSTFLSSMSHEIRTPLNAMIGYMTIASSSIDNREKVIHCIDSAGIAARHLLSVINDVLDISSMESGKMKLAKERFDLKEQLSGISAMFYQQCRQKNVKFAVAIDGLTEEWVVGDSMRVNQILMNLMSNAVKFTSAGSVSLAVAQTAQTDKQVYIRFVVQDTGIGMSEEYLSRLFSPFEQESAQTARKFGGTGLGMSITLNLVNLMGGKIDVTSKQGEGSKFSVTLPFERTENLGAKVAPKDFAHLRILIVDDQENECDYIRALLDRCGVYSESAGSGEEAIRLVAQKKGTPERFDLCIIDWNMPGLDGVETTKLIHRECDPDIPIIIATAYDISEFETEAMAAGAARIISKPLFQSTLLDLLVTTYGKYTAAAGDDGDIPDLSGMHVLLAEDNETNVEVAVDLLELAGVTADIARNGLEAVDLFREKGSGYDAILMDVQMPVMDGYAATRLIREAPEAWAREIPIIALTADAFAENVAAALAAGMDDHVAKPIETDVLFAVLKKAYQRRRA